MTNNQIIAEYLGWKLTYVKNEYVNYWEFQNHNNLDEEGLPDTDDLLGFCAEYSQLPYNSSWNYFMDCMTKINSDFELLDSCTDDLWHIYDLLRTKVANVDLEAANEQAVLFINELNRIKNENRENKH